MLHFSIPVTAVSIATSREQLDGYLAVEPYVQEHVWDRIEVEQVNVVIR